MAASAIVRRRTVFSIIGWLLFLLVAGIAWYSLLSVAVPARVDFNGERGTVLGTFIPPFLLTLICWTGWRRLAPSATFARTPAVANAEASSPVLAVAPLPKGRFRIGAWSVMTPQGDAAGTAERTKARETVFRPDKAIALENGNPAHAGMLATLKLERAGYPATTRVRAPRVAVMLTGILDDILSRQISIPETIEGPANVYWIVPRTLLVDEKFHIDIFEAAWRRSEWREHAYLLHIVPSTPAAGYAIVSQLQKGIDDSTLPYILVVAADSLLDSNELVLAEIFSIASPLGYIPAEGAAGFLLFNPAKSPQGMWANSATLAPVIMMQFPPEQAAKDAAKTLSQAMAASISAGATSSADVKLVISDTDHRVQGSMAVIGALAQVMNHLDPLEDRLCPMEYAGSFGAATDVIHLALAMEMATGDSQVVCVICNAHTQVASVLVLPA